MSLDLLVFGPHPDDLEIGLAATIAKHAAAGRTVGLCDLTAGELGSNGTPDERRREADAAARVLGAAWRENLGWPDGGITGTPEQLRAAVRLIRTHRPRTIAVPYWKDRHPDHADASRALTRAAFLSALRRYAAEADPWRADWIVYYFINDSAPPSFVVDVSAHYAAKREALDCHRSQFSPAGSSAVPTRLTAASFRQLIESRDAQFGAQLGVAYAEGFVVRTPIERATLLRDEIMSASDAAGGPRDGAPGTERARASEPAERSGDRGAPASDAAGGPRDGAPGTERARASEPAERSGDRGVPASDAAGGPRGGAPGEE